MDIVWGKEVNVILAVRLIVEWKLSMNENVLQLSDIRKCLMVRQEIVIVFLQVIFNKFRVSIP